MVTLSQFKRSVKSYPWLSFFSLIALISLLALGTWQVYRLQWKLELIRQVEEKSKLPSVAIPRSEDDIKNMQFQKVRANGRFLNKYELHLVGRYNKGKMGYHVITPFALDNGKVILVNRGWVPTDKKQSNKRPGSLVKGKTTVEGILVKPYKNYWYLPKNNTKDNLWFSFPLAEMQSYTGLKLLPMILQEAGAQKYDLPVKISHKVELRNDHLHYAIVWYSLAVALLVIYFIFTGKQKKK